MYFHALKQSAEQDNATPLESHSVGFEIQMWTEELVALFQVHLLYFCYGKVKKVKTLRIYLPKQCPFGPIPARSRRAHGAGVKTPISCGLGTGEEEANEISVSDLP